MRISDWSSDVCSSDLRRIIESLNRPLRPTVAFHEQGHCQEDWRRCGRQSDADPHVTALRETPFEGSTYIVEARKVWRALLSGDRKSTRLNSSHYCAYRMPSSA